MAKAQDRDKFGYCVKCHKYLLREVIDMNEVVLVPTADSDSEIFLLNDGSQMRVSICTDCKRELKDEDFDYVMDCVVQGWDWETDQLVNDEKKPLWDKEKKKKYMDRHSALKIITKPRGLTKAEIERRVKKHKQKAKNGSNN